MSKEQRQQKRQKVTPVTARATFNDFFSAILDLRAAHPAIERYFSEIEPGASYDEYLSYVAVMAGDQYPQLLDNKNIHTQYFITPSTVSVRTEDKISFGWKVTYRVEDGQAVITSVSVSVTLYDEFADEKRNLQESGWVLEEQKPRQRRRNPNN